VTGQMHDGSIVHCRGVTRSFGSGAGRVTALRGVDLDVRGGELLMLVGPSGCGKTTLLSIVGAMLDRDTGDCRVMGRDPASLGAKQRAALRNQLIGFIFQGFNLLPALSASDNVAVPLIIAGRRARQARERARQLLDAVGLGDRLEALPRDLSGGQQQRVAIARALARDPPLVLCDEPTSNLDHETGGRVLDLLRRNAGSSDRALLVATHDSRILPFADRIARMEDGRIVDVSAPERSAAGQ